METRTLRVYNGDLYDKKNQTTDRFLAVNSCGVHVNGYQHTIRQRGRKDYHLLYVESGELILQGEQKNETVLPGGFAIYPPGVRHDYIQYTGVCYWVHFTGTGVEELLSEAGLSETRCYAGKKHESAVSRSFERMIFHDASHSSLRELTLCADLLALIAEIGRLMQGDRESYGDERLRPIVLHMNKHYEQEVDLDAYARMAGLSRGRFLHLFKEVMTVSPYAYVLDLRLNRAAELLLSTDEPVSSVAFSVGFSDPLYFSRLFKKKYQSSPEKFRKKG